MLQLPHQQTAAPHPSPDTSEAGSPCSPDPLADLHIDEPIDAVENEAGGDPGPDGAACDTPPGTLTREQFKDAFGGALTLAGTLTQLQTLKGSPDLPSFPPAADAIYDTALDSPWLRFLIEPGSVWAARVLAIAAFAGPVAFGCRHEIAARNAQPVRQDETAPGANQAEPESQDSADAVAT